GWYLTMKNTKKRGFTIVELVIVIAVIAILASVLVPTFANVVTKAKRSAAMQDARNAYTDYLVKHDGELPKDGVCIKSGEYYFEVKAGQFTGNECSNGSAHKYYTISNGALVGPGTENHTATTTTTTTTTQPAGGENAG
ncbi:MAG: type II secretion system protein, partial [Eubacteriales bacterium]|nr:type II secretion system protein [Eubacteriales bacterium]